MAIWRVFQKMRNLNNSIQSVLAMQILDYNYRIENCVWEVIDYVGGNGIMKESEKIDHSTVVKDFD